MKQDLSEKRRCLFRRRKMLKASFTVEASVIIPIIFFLIAFSLKVAMDQYGLIQTFAEEPIRLEEETPVKVMWETDRILKGLKNEN